MEYINSPDNELHLDWKVITTILSSTLLLVIQSYGTIIQNHTWSSIVFYFLVPMFLIVIIYRQPARQFGFQLGDWKTGFTLTLLACLFLRILMHWIAQLPAFNAYYSPLYNNTSDVIVHQGLELFAWEFFFRGFLLFSLYQVCGPYALILQAVPFTIAHFGKPELETLSCIFGGTAFGWLAWRTKSFLYPFLVHWFLGSITILIASGIIK
jgi:uncharacterized protein